MVDAAREVGRVGYIDDGVLSQWSLFIFIFKEYGIT